MRDLLHSLRVLLRLYARALLLGGVSLWRAFSLVLGLGLFAAASALAGLTAPVAIVVALVGILVAGQVGALRIASGAEHELEQWRQRPASAQHQFELQEALRNALFMMANGRVVEFDQPGGQPLRQTMIHEHFPEIAAGLDDWNQTASLRPDAAVSLTARLKREVSKRSLDELPYYPEVLIDCINEFLFERAVRGELDEELKLEPNQGTIWRHTALVGFDMRRGRAIDTHDIPEEQYFERVGDRVAPVNELITEAHNWPETKEIAAAQHTLDHKQADHTLKDLILAQLLREQIYVAACCPACGEHASS